MINLLKRKKLKIRIEPGDEVYLKDTFKKYFTKELGLLFREELGKFNGQRVRIISVIRHYHDQKESTYSFTAIRVDGLKQYEQFPLVCIDRRQPLIRNGKRISLLNKELYILIK